MIAPHLTKSGKDLRIATSVKNHFDKLHREQPFRSSTSALRDDLRQLTLTETNVILDSFESLKPEESQNQLLYPAFREVIIAAHEADVVDKHRLLGKFAVSLLRLVDSE